MQWWYWALLAVFVAWGILTPGIGGKIAEATERGEPWWRGIVPGIKLIAVIWLPALGVALFLIYVVKIK